jgi:excisionase family DNA binding protein
VTAAAGKRMAYSPREAEELLGVGHSYIYELISSGKLRSIKVGGRRLIPHSAIAELLGEEAA